MSQYFGTAPKEKIILAALLISSFFGAVLLLFPSSSTPIYDYNNYDKLVSESSINTKSAFDSLQTQFINNMKQEQWMEIKGIGPVLSEKILARKKEFGDFKSNTDLLSVKGIGEKKLAQILTYINVKIKH